MNSGNKILRGLAILLFAVVLGTAAFGQQPSGSANNNPQIVITAKRYSFSPDTITLTKGQPVTIVLKSEDVAHGLRIKDLNFNLESKPNHPETAVLTPSQTGEFKGACSRFCGVGHGSMRITVKVVEPTVAAQQ